jgi:RNA processing factor Prp31
LARVLDEDGTVLDEVVWDGHRTLSTLTDRLAQLQAGRLVSEMRTLLERFPEATPDPLGAISDPDWPELDEEEGNLLQGATTMLAKRGVADAAGDVDRRLDMLVSATGELRSAWTTNEARCVEWAGLFITEADLDGQRAQIPPSIADASKIADAAEALGVAPPVHTPTEIEWEALKSHACGVVASTRRLQEHEDAIREIASSHIPSLSALIGPLGAAKLVVLAGGRERLSRMPSGSLQVLGAHAAMAAHRRGAPPPKHGAILFSMPQVSRSPRWVRGKIARFLAGKASIAVRVDHFGGVPWSQEQVDEINSRVDAIKAKFPKPPKRG